MKKIFLVLMSALIISLVFSLAFALYDSSTDVVTYKLKKGWNTMSLMPGLESLEGTCGEYGGEGKSKWGGWYMYVPTLGKYLVAGPPVPGSERVEKDGEEGYFYPVFGGYFAYVTEDCEFTLPSYSVMYPAVKIAQGWQFIPKRPLISNFNSAFAGCEIVKFNQWSNTEKDWVYKPSKTSKEELGSAWNSADFGDIFIIKFAKECELVYGLGLPE